MGFNVAKLRPVSYTKCLQGTYLVNEIITDLLG
jgi:hypothetical protein